MAAVVAAAFAALAMSYRGWKGFRTMFLSAAKPKGRFKRRRRYEMKLPEADLSKRP